MFKNTFILDKPRGYHMKWSQSDLKVIASERQIWYHLYVDSRNDINELIYKTETDSQHRKQTYGYQRGKGVGKEQFRSLGLADTDDYL